MEITALIELIPTLGFPIFCVLGLGWFIFKIYNDTTKQNAEQMATLQEKSQEREDKLYEQLAKQNETNGKFAEIIGRYEAKLDEIKSDVKEIKNDIIEIKAHQ